MLKERTRDLAVMTVVGIQVLPEESSLGDWPPSHHLNKRKSIYTLFVLVVHVTALGCSNTKRENPTSYVLIGITTVVS